MTDRLTHEETCALLKAPAAGPEQSRLKTGIYEELRTIADGMFRAERAGHLLQPTALVHEAFLRLAEHPRLDPDARTRFLAIAAGEMRRVLIDHARRRDSQKRGGGWGRLTLECAAVKLQARDWDATIFAETLKRLGTMSERQLRVVELRIFGGLTIQEIARELSVSTTTVEDDWYAARAWLRRELGGRGE